MVDPSPSRVIDGRVLPAVGRWEFDPGHTTVGFEGRHLMVSRIHGRFQRFSGHIDVAEIPEESRAELEIDAASLDSGFKDRDDHLRSPDWFDVGQYPTIRFESTRARHVIHNRWLGTGLLSIRNVTRPIDVDIEFGGVATDPWGNQKVGALVTARVDREEFGLTWNMPLQAGGLLVSKQIQLTVAIEAVRMASTRSGTSDYHTNGTRRFRRAA